MKDVEKKIEQIQVQIMQINKKLDFFIDVYNSRFSLNRYVEKEQIDKDKFSPLKEG